jgi:DNA-binding MarR family transcriptional regulator
VGGLVDRAEAAGLVERHPDRNDHRAVRLRVTPTGLRSLDRLTEAHLTELAQLADRLRPLWTGFAERGHFAEP